MDAAKDTRPISPSKPSGPPDKADHHHLKGGHAHPKGNRRHVNLKKGGGGKGSWGRPGDELRDLHQDHDDPSYDPTEDDQDGVKLSETAYPLEPAEIKNLLEPLVKEYFDTGDSNEVLLACKNVSFGDRADVVCEVIVRLGLDRTDAERELCSNLISDLYSVILHENDIERAFALLLADISDLKLDTPDAADILGRFMARAVADDCLAPAFINNHPASAGDFPNPGVRAAIKKAHTLISMSHGMARLEQIWGVHGVLKPVRALVNDIHAILDEYSNAEDCEEVHRSLQQLGVPHFHHEVVYEAIQIVLAGGERESTLILKLLKHLSSSGFLTIDQLEAGFERTYSEITDLCLDIPKAATILDEFAQRALAEGVITKTSQEKSQERGSRKRFLSENNDGGKIKEAN
eukprot:m.132774 g.132774  ORF g.132774 m.132774 type:complete len:405 (-) comp16494_c0_seq3:1377-2591(-)